MTTKGAQVHTLLALASELAHEAGWNLDKFQDEGAAYYLAAEGETRDQNEASTQALSSAELPDPASGVQRRRPADRIREGVHTGRFARLGETRVPPRDASKPEADAPVADLDNDGAHATHCCTHHGCKYGEGDCPVVEGRVKQEDPCEYCAEIAAEAAHDCRSRLKCHERFSPGVHDVHCGVPRLKCPDPACGSTDIEDFSCLMLVCKRCDCCWEKT